MGVVKDLLSNKDDSQLDGQLQQAAIGGTLIQTKWTNALVASRSSRQTMHGCMGEGEEQGAEKSLLPYNVSLQESVGVAHAVLYTIMNSHPNFKVTYKSTSTYTPVHEICGGTVCHIQVLCCLGAMGNWKGRSGRVYRTSYPGVM